MEDESTSGFHKHMCYAPQHNGMHIHMKKGKRERIRDYT